MFSFDDPKARRRALLIAAPIAAVIGLAIFFFLGGFNIFRQEARGAYQVIDKDLPVTGKGDQMAARLNKMDPSWQAQWIAKPKGQTPAGITEDVSDSKGIITNVGNDQSVQQNGALLLVWDGYGPDVLAELKRELNPFAPGVGGKDLERYQIGTWAAYYAPGTGAANKTKEVKDYLTVASWCPYNTKDCPDAFKPRS